MAKKFEFDNIEMPALNDFHDKSKDTVKSNAFGFMNTSQPQFSLESLIRTSSTRITFNLKDTSIGLLKTFARSKDLKFSDLVDIAILRLLEEQGVAVEEAGKEIFPFFKAEKELRKWFKMRPSKFEDNENFELRDDYLEPKFFKKIGVTNERELYQKVTALNKEINELPQSLSILTAESLGTDLSSMRALLVTQAATIKAHLESLIENK
ncbi:hypothetical protein ACFC9N_10890 [Enterococcus casseliflavus]|uniref:hypothetical protein n=1 Tax=Enterococcus TaxID=1350 RepID=UPI000A392596|nr:hypothetical protein [Enterococcus sp. 4E1_DIV0656]OTO09182.1 hypothetical protein A5882_003512 [Enterococcus sp. 4E1_DIV0656]